MPELPEVEIVCRGLASRLCRRKFIQVVQNCRRLRFQIPRNFEKRLIGRRVESVRRRAKYILIQFDDASILLAHLGMSGRISIREGQPKPAGIHDHVVFHTDDGASITFNDSRRFGFLTLVDKNCLLRHPLLMNLGPEPLDDDFNGDLLARRLAGRQTPIKCALLNQRLIAGLGNIYACESLFRARLSPRRLAKTVQGKRAELLAEAIRGVLEEAIRAGGSSLRDYFQTSGELGYFQNLLAVYGREGYPCPGCHCGRSVRRIVQAGRSTFFCSQRQR